MHGGETALEFARPAPEVQRTPYLDWKGPSGLFERVEVTLKQKTYLTDIQTKLNQDHFHTSGNPLLFAL